MSKPCPHCSVTTGPAIRELRRDSFKEAVKLMHEANFPANGDGSPTWGFDETMTLACHLIGLGEAEDDD